MAASARMTPHDPPPPTFLAGQRVALVGRWVSMPRREAAEALRTAGALVSERIDDTTQLAIVGESAPSDPAAAAALLPEPARQALHDGRLRLMRESELWQQLGLVDQPAEIRRLYTPAMLAELLGVSVATVRGWHRRGLIVPDREVKHLPYFDFREVSVARRLAELLEAGVSSRSIARQLRTLAQRLPGVARPLAELSLVIRDKQILLREGEALVEPHGQRQFDFERKSADEAAGDLPFTAFESGVAGENGGPSPVASARQAPAFDDEGPTSLALPTAPEQMLRLAAELEEDDQPAAAAEMLRAALAAGGPTADACFQLAELLYRLGDLPAARERYYMAIEIDEDYVEARANLGCLLDEMAEPELAVAALQGALRHHADYADAHYHLARILDELERRDEAEEHWRWFLGLAPDSPWAEEAERRLDDAPQRLF